MKEYFDVDNQYVLKKLLIILFPFTVRGEDGWKRKNGASYDFSNEEEYNATRSPRNDEQAPDLYIPLMAHITFIIICGCV